MHYLLYRKDLHFVMIGAAREERRIKSLPIVGRPLLLQTA
jgi:hypothetical protein